MKNIIIPPLKLYELDDPKAKEAHEALLTQLPKDSNAIGFCILGVVVQNRRTGSYLVVGHAGEFVYLDYDPFAPLST